MKSDLLRDADVALPVHGGDVAGIAGRLGIEASRLIDFSANINPRGPSQNVLAAINEAAADVVALRRYPSPDSPILRAKIAQRFGIDPNQIVVGHGSAGLLDTIVRTLAPSVALVPVPAFSEYHRVCRAVGCEFVPFVLESDADFRLDCLRFINVVRRVRPNIVVLNNPHNPSGSVIRSEEVLAIAKAAQSIDAVAIVDEAFIDYVPAASIVCDAGASESLIVLRSFTKFYAFPGLRVGYAVASVGNARRIRCALPSWPVSSIALAAAEAALDDPVFEDRTLVQNSLERQRVLRAITSLGIGVTPSAANYLLLECSSIAKTSTSLTSMLIANSDIVVRDCSDYASLHDKAFIRVAIRDPDQNDRLIAALVSVRASAGESDRL